MFCLRIGRVIAQRWAAETLHDEPSSLSHPARRMLFMKCTDGEGGRTFLVEA
jgi:hypothetical protein